MCGVRWATEGSVRPKWGSLLLRAGRRPQDDRAVSFRRLLALALHVYSKRGEGCRGQAQAQDIAHHDCVRSATALHIMHNACAGALDLGKMIERTNSSTFKSRELGRGRGAGCVLRVRSVNRLCVRHHRTSDLCLFGSVGLWLLRMCRTEV